MTLKEDHTPFKTSLKFPSLASLARNSREKKTAAPLLAQKKLGRIS